MRRTGRRQDTPVSQCYRCQNAAAHSLVKVSKSRSNNNFRNLSNLSNRRSEGDNGSFRRNDDREPSRADADSGWRRGGGGGGDRYGDSRGGGGYNNDRYGDSRGGGGYNDRYGGGGGDSGGSRWGRGGSGGSSRFDDRPPYGSPSPSSSGGRPRLNLSKRSADPKAAEVPSPSGKSNIFGSARAVDTASKFAAVEEKERQERERREKERAERRAQKEAAAAKKETEEKAGEAEGEKDSPAKSAAPKDEPQDAAAVTDDEKKEDDNAGAGGEKKERKERKIREPKVVNSRAAMLGEVNAPKPEVSP